MSPGSSARVAAERPVPLTPGVLADQIGIVGVSLDPLCDERALRVHTFALGPDRIQRRPGESRSHTLPFSGRLNGSVGEHDDVTSALILGATQQFFARTSLELLTLRSVLDVDFCHFPL